MTMVSTHNFSDLASFLQVQAIGINAYGNEAPQGIPGRIELANNVLQATLYDTDEEVNLGQRSEVRLDADSNAEYWYKFEMRLGAGWVFDEPMLVFQMHDTPFDGVNDRTPNLMLVAEDGQLICITPTTMPAETNQATRAARIPVVPGEWFEVMVHARWKPDTTGFREVFIDRRPLLKQFSVATQYTGDTDGPYLKLGIYNYFHKLAYLPKNTEYRNLTRWTNKEGYSRVLGSPPLPVRRYVI